MINHQSTICEIKSELLDLLTGNKTGLSYKEWFTTIKPNLDKHFGIKDSELFLYESTRKCYLSAKNYEKAVVGKTLEAVRLNEESIQNFTAKTFIEIGLPHMDDIIEFKSSERKPLAILFLQSTPQWEAFSMTPFLEDLKDSVSAFILGIKELESLILREKKYRRLFNVTELFNATMESDVVLDGIIDTVSHFFPKTNIELLLSHEEKQRTKSFKLFDYINESPSAIEAFVSGDITTETISDSDSLLINAPIKGRQGIYGVLKIRTEENSYLSKTQLNLVRMLSNTAGSALENASLYDQSHRLIEDLQLVNETSRKLNSNMPFGEMIAYLKQQLITAFEPSEIAFVFYNEKGEGNVYTGTDYFNKVEGKQYIEYTNNYLKSGKNSLFDATFGKRINDSVDFEAIIGIPITNQEELVGFVICLHVESYFFSFENFKLMQSLIRHSSLALANSMLRDQLQELVDKDHLTKLYARNYLDNITEKSIEKNEGGVLLLFDIDNFKLVNDTHGHDIGDEVLKQIGRLLSEKVIEKGFAARWGGEEFAVYLPITSEEAGLDFAKELIKDIPLFTSPSVTVSIGLTAWEEKEKILFKNLFKFTDTALYKAKSTGKNKVVVHGLISS